MVLAATQTSAQPLADSVEVKVPGSTNRTWYRRLARDKVAVAMIVVLAAFVVLGLLAPVLPISDPIKTDPRMKNLPLWSDGHLLGTDQVGRDILARIIWGSRTTLMLGVVAAFTSTVIGLVLGLTAGYFGGFVDTVIMRAVDVTLAFPSILFAIVVVAILGPSLRNALLAIALLGVPFYVRLVRAEVLRLTSLDFVTAAKTIGAPSRQILTRHLFPNIISPIIVTSSIHIGGLILEAGGLSFLGLGAQPPSPEWGAMVASGRNQLLLAPHVVLVPSVAIFIVVLAFNLLGDGMRDALDPKSK